MAELQPRVLLLAALAAGLHLALFRGAGPVDDDFISYRYARNLVRGLGLVYQEGERVEGFTNPLWVLIHAAGLALDVAPVLLTRVLGVASVVACLVFAASAEATLRGRDDRLRLAPFAIALCPALAFHAAAGLGTVLMSALLLGWFAAWLLASEAQEPPRLAALLLALACLLRQEAVLFALPFALAARRSIWVLLPLLSLAAWTGFRLLYYGEWLPQTFAVKRLPLAADLGFGWRYLVTSTVVAGVGIYTLLALFAPLRAEPSHARSVVWAAVAGLLVHTLYVVAAGGDYLALARFFVPTLPLALTLACIAMGPGKGGVGPFLTTGFIGLWVVFLWPHIPVRSEHRWATHSSGYLHALHEFQEERWASLGRVFRASTSDNAVICLSPIGAFGWESDRRIVDVLGLTNAGIAEVEPDLSIPMKGHQRFDGELTLEQAPDYVILGNGVRDWRTGRVSVNPWERDLVGLPEFQASYTHQVLPIPGGDPVDVWVRAGAPALGTER